MTLFSKILMFSKEEFDDLKIRMQAHLAGQDDDLCGAPQMIEKYRSKWTTEDKKKENLDNVSKDILYKTLNKNTFSKIKMCKAVKEIWEKLIQICEGNEQTKKEKLSVTTQMFDNIKMKPGESIIECDKRISNIVIDLLALGKTYTN
ncbi:uncharacterized protein [Henckelia pumila]|uniref:uncharacterized protein n=1 Tax=Henckelia pumila TaxID=405737 RepID=UPI003C6E7CE4